MYPVYTLDWSYVPRDITTPLAPVVQQHPVPDVGV